MVDPVSRPVISWIVTFALTFTLGIAGVVAHESGATDKQVEQEAEHLHTDGHQEENERVPAFIHDEQLGEDAGQRDDDPCCA